MTKKMPPIPEENRSDFGPGDEGRDDAAQASTVKDSDASTRTGRQANIKINTTHQGYQQDR